MNLLKKLDSYLLSKPKIHLCWLFEKLGLPVPRYFVGAPGYGPDLITGGTPSADSEATDGTSYAAFRACDNNEGTYWASGDGPAPYPHWWKYDFGSAKVVTKLRIKAKDGDLKGFILQGSPNDSTWYTVHSGQQAWDDNWQDYTFANTTAYRYYRIYSAGPNWPGHGWMQIFEIEMMESEPAAPSGCASSYVATNNAKCTWSDNSQNETNFRIEKDIDGAGFSFWKNVAANVEDSGTYTLGANHQIRFRVRSYNAIGYSAWSTSGYTYTTPTAPSGCTASYVATDKSKCVWSDNSAYEDGFKVEFKLDGGGWTAHQTVGANVETSSEKTVGADHKIEWRVYAYKGALNSGYSTDVTIIYTTPNTPSDIALSWETQDETVRITWTDNSDWEQDFDIERDIDDAGFAHIVYDVASPYDDTGPAGEDHKYKYRARARCPDGRLSGWNTSGYIYSTANIFKERDIVYDLSIFIDKERNIVYDLSIFVDKERNILYDSILELSKARNILYDSVWEISKTRNILYNLVLGLSKERSIVYSIEWEPTVWKEAILQHSHEGNVGNIAALWTGKLISSFAHLMGYDYVAEEHKYVALDPSTKALLLLSEITGTFVNLIDTPGDYSGKGSLYPRVKVDESGLEFVEGTGAGVTDHGLLTGLGDNDHTQYLLKAGGTMVGVLILAGAPTEDLHASTKKYVDDNIGAGGAVTFLDLTDSPAAYGGHANKMVTVKATEDGVEFTSIPGGGDMLKSVYDQNESGVVDNAEKLEGSIKTEVQDHVPKVHKLNAHDCPDGDVDFGGFKAIDVANPTAPQDGATKAYVDSLVP